MVRRRDGKGAGLRRVIVDGFEVLIGKGDAENDELTLTVADPADFWLHVAGVPGSHVVVRNPDRLETLPREVIQRAAELAAYYSKARERGMVDVHLCRVADVSKRRGLAPGEVILTRWTRIRARPRL